MKLKIIINKNDLIKSFCLSVDHFGFSIGYEYPTSERAALRMQ